MLSIQILEEVNSNLPEGFMPYTIYAIIVDELQVGTLVYRTGNCEERYYDGHIAYTIEPEYRGHHYAYQATQLLLNQIDHDVIITCDPHNLASKKTIQKLGLSYIETVAIPKSLKKFFTKDELLKEIYIRRINHG